MNFIKNKKVLSILSLSFIFSILPKTISALSWNPLDWTIIGLPALLIGTILGVATKVSALGALILANLLNWIIGPNFLSWSWTQPGGDHGNPIIAVGLNITKNFVNLGLVLILIFIAFSVALRLKQYATEKTLVRLIIIALLVNFAPVVCGLIVDASNIIMNFFLQGLEKGIANMLTNISVDSIVSDLLGLLGGNLATKMSLLTESIITIILNLSLTFTFLILIALFLLRYIAIWLLVILSPLAFLAWILPATKKFWDQWWNQLIQWSFIGVPIAFFLYLAMASFGGLQAEFEDRMAMPGLDSGIINILNMSFPYFVVIAIIGIGFVVGLSSAAMGTKAITNYANTKGKKMMAGAREKAKTGAKIMATKTRNKLSSIKGLNEWGEKQASARKWGEGMSGWSGTWRKGLSTINPGRYARRGLGKAISTGTIESEQAMTKKAEEKNKDTSVETKQEHYHHAITDNERIGVINQAIKEGQIDEFMDDLKYGKSAVSKEEIKIIRNRAKKYKDNKTIDKAFVDIATEDVTKEEFEDAHKKDPKIITKERFIMNKMKPIDYENIPKSTLKNLKNMDAIISTATGSHIQKLIDSQGSSAARSIERATKSLAALNSTKTGIHMTASEYILKENPKLHKYLTSGGGRGLINI